ncbi:hypothetical protein PQR53_30715 [Paraburkholderia fungorum]
MQGETIIGGEAIKGAGGAMCAQATVPDALLPEALQEGKPLDIWRLRDG